MQTKDFKRVGTTKATFFLQTEIDTGRPFDAVEGDMVDGIIREARPRYESDASVKLLRSRATELNQASRRADGLEARLTALRSERRAAELLDDAAPLAPRLSRIDREIQNAEQHLAEARDAVRTLAPVVTELQKKW